MLLFLNFFIRLTYVTIQSHLDDLMTFDSSNNFNEEEHQLNLFGVFLKRDKMDLERERYFSYEEMSSRELDSYYFRLD